MPANCSSKAVQQHLRFVFDMRAPDEINSECHKPLNQGTSKNVICITLADLKHTKKYYI